MHHHLVDMGVAQIENTAQHVAIAFAHTAFLMVQVDGAAQFFMRRQQAAGTGTGKSGGAQNRARNKLQQLGEGCENADQNAQQPGGAQRGLVGRLNGVGFGQNFGKDNDQHGHHQSCVDNPRLAEQPQKNTGCQHRSQNIDQIIAEQNRAETAFHAGREDMPPIRRGASLPVACATCARGLSPSVPFPNRTKMPTI